MEEPEVTEPVVVAAEGQSVVLLAVSLVSEQAAQVGPDIIMGVEQLGLLLTTMTVLTTGAGTVRAERPVVPVDAAVCVILLAVFFSQRVEGQEREPLIGMLQLGPTQVRLAERGSQESQGLLEAGLYQETAVGTDMVAVVVAVLVVRVGAVGAEARVVPVVPERPVHMVGTAEVEDAPLIYFGFLLFTYATDLRWELWVLVGILMLGPGAREGIA